MVVYSSPRKMSNSSALAKEFAIQAGKTCMVKEISLQDVTLQPCKACRWCKTHHRCLLRDEMNDLVLTLKGSDGLCLATPVYWWGVSSQLKVFIDRLYQLDIQDFKGKKLYVIATGEDSLEGIQYRLIREQFEAICEYTGMIFAGYLPVCASDSNPVQERAEALQQARTLFIPA